MSSSSELFKVWGLRLPNLFTRTAGLCARIPGNPSGFFGVSPKSSHSLYSASSTPVSFQKRRGSNKVWRRGWWTGIWAPLTPRQASSGAWRSDFWRRGSVNGGGFGGDFCEHVGRQSRVALFPGDSLPAGINPLQISGDGATSRGFCSDRRHVQPGETRNRIALFAGRVGERKTEIVGPLVTAGGSGSGNRLCSGLDEFAGGVLNASHARAGADRRIQFGITNRTGRGMQLTHGLLRAW